MASLLARIMLLVAVLLMPVGMSPAAAAPVHHQMEAGMPMGHCPEPTPSHDQKGGFAECTMACAAALPAVEAATAEPPLVHAALPRLATTEPLHGLHPETATPPPRGS